MSRDVYPRSRYAVTFAVTLFVDAETEDRAADYAEERLTDALDIDALGSWRVEVEEVTREGA